MPCWLDWLYDVYWDDGFRLSAPPLLTSLGVGGTRLMPGWLEMAGGLGRMHALFVDELIPTNKYVRSFALNDAQVARRGSEQAARGRQRQCRPRRSSRAQPAAEPVQDDVDGEDKGRGEQSTRRPSAPIDLRLGSLVARAARDGHPEPARFIWPVYCWVTERPDAQPVGADAHATKHCAAKSNGGDRLLLWNARVSGAGRATSNADSLTALARASAGDGTATLARAY